MAKALQRARLSCVERGREIFENLKKDNLWKRILKNVIATTAAVSICLIPGAKATLGRAAYLAPMTTVFGHPGRRFGTMVEALVLALCGTLLGVAWSTLGIYLGSLVFSGNPSAAYAIRGVFLAMVVMLHGFLRSRTPRLFIFVLLLIIVSVVSLTSTATVVTSAFATQILYPILIAVCVIILVNLSFFPEFSSSFLGHVTIDTLNDTAKALEDAGRYFTYISHASRVEKPRKPTSPQKADDSKISDGTGVVSLSALTTAKGKLRTKLSSCRAAQRECNFEIAVSVLPPRNMKFISVASMKKLVANTVALIGACESKYALLGGVDDNNQKEGSGPPEETPVRSQIKASRNEKNSIKNGQNISSEKAELDLIKPRREIEFGDVHLFRYLLGTVAKPYEDLQALITRSVDVVSACIGYTYDVPRLPSGARVPKGIIIEEVDLHIYNLQQALITFDGSTASALEKAAVMQEVKDQEPDIMPREEIFLIASFLLNLRQAASHLEAMLKHSRDLVLQREHRHGRRTIYAPHIRWATWLYSGGGEDEALPTSGRKANREGTRDEGADDDDDTAASDSHKGLLDDHKKHDLEKSAGLNNGQEKPKAQLEAKAPSKRKIPEESRPSQMSTSPWMRLRGQLADTLEWMQGSEDFLYAIKITVAVFLVVWPALVASWNNWYSLNRGLWAALQLVLITEVSIGNSITTFIIRAIGTTLGCLWGWAAWEARKGNPIVCAVMIFLGTIPSAYIQLGTKYPKAGMVSIISMAVVALSTELVTVPGTATENFLKRWIAFMIGGAVALLVEVILLPVKARSRLVESLAAAIKQINEMQSCVAFGIEEGANHDVYAPELFLRFDKASGKANGALDAAETFLPFCSTEPRIKGSFEGLAMIYEEIIFVLHQIVDRMDNMLQLRTAYGFGPLEEFNTQIYPYRRNVAGSIALTLFAIHGALTTKLPLPQFFPSARLAHLRMINRVREVVQQATGNVQNHQETSKSVHQRAVRRKYMSWNAASAARAEVIEFLEELIDLTKLLVGANEFRSGLLTRPTYREYVENMEHEKSRDPEEKSEARDEIRETPLDKQGLTRRKRGTTSSSHDDDEEIPASLRRIQSRKIEAGTRRQRTNDS